MKTRIRNSKLEGQPVRAARWTHGKVREQSSKLGSESGQSLIEFALLTPLLVLLLLGLIEVGQYAYISILVGNAARAGAAYGSESLGNAVNTAGIEAAANNDYQGNGQSVSLTFVPAPSVSCGCDNGAAISPDTPAACYPANQSQATCPLGGHWVVSVSVTASGTFNSLFNYPGIPDPLTISRTATMQVATN